MLSNPKDLVDSLDPKFPSLLDKMNANNIIFKDFALKKEPLFYSERTHADNVLYSMFNFNVVKHIGFLQNFKKITHYKVDVSRCNNSTYTLVVTSAEDDNNVLLCIAEQFMMTEGERVTSNKDLASFSNGRDTIVINKINDSEWHLVNSNICTKICNVFKGMHSDSEKDKVSKKFNKLSALYASRKYFGTDYIRNDNHHLSKEIYSLELNNFVAVFKEVMDKICGQYLPLSLCQELFAAYFEIKSWHLVSQAQKTEIITPYAINFSCRYINKQFLVKDFSSAIAMFLDLSKEFENINLVPCFMNDNAFHSTSDNKEKVDFRFYARPSIGIFKEQFK